MTRLNYKKTKKINNTPKHINQFGIQKEIKKSWKIIEEKYGKTYEGGAFFINRKPVEKYTPRKYQDKDGKIITVAPMINGVFFNTATANFEVIKKGQVLSKIHWKVGQARIVEWKDKYGV